MHLYSLKGLTLNNSLLICRGALFPRPRATDLETPCSGIGSYPFPLGRPSLGPGRAGGFCRAAYCGRPTGLRCFWISFEPSPFSERFWVLVQGSPPLAARTYVMRK